MIVRNVNEALYRLLLLYQHPKDKVYRELHARGTCTWELREMPFITQYMMPDECVLFSPTRNANPFFHFFEALHLLAGRDDLKFMTHLLARYSDFSDDGERLHGAYGVRIRECDQLMEAIFEMKRDPDSRRAVVAIWQPEHDAGYRGKDMPCNCLVDFKLREGALHMVVHDRSNDAVWGAYGSNVVQFSFLQQYVAMHLDCKIGTYSQVSDSMHVYPDNEPTKTLLRDADILKTDAYENGWVKPQPFLSDPFMTAEDWDADLSLFFALFDEDKIGSSDLYHTDWWINTAYPMWMAFTHYKAGDLGQALSSAEMIRSTDWHMAALQWLRRIELKRDQGTEL